MRSSTQSRLAALIVALSGCYNGVGADPGVDPPEPETGSFAEDSGGSVGTEEDAEPDCEPGAIAPAPMRRLTRLEYDNTVRDLLADLSATADQFTPDENIAGFAANAVAPLAQAQVDQYMAAAEQLAASAVADRWDTVVGCDRSDPACGPAFIARFGRQAFRRPLTEAQLADYVQLFEATQVESDPTAAFEAVIAAMLMSPNFLYHVEPTQEGKSTAIDSYAVAARLSYFVWATMPDEELFDAAEAGDLQDSAAIEQQARRMLADPRSDAAVASFHDQWLGTAGLGDVTKDAERFPQWTPAVAASAAREAGRFAAEVLRHGDGSLHTLLTANWTVADHDLAALYGVADPADEVGVIDLDPQTRAGVLTQIGFLAAKAHAAEVSWVHRGNFVRGQLLCHTLPAPPAGVEMTETNDPDRLKNPSCAGCHLMMDPIGRGFDNYSAIGGLQNVDESGSAIDAAGEVVGVDDIGEFDGPVELAGTLAASPTVHACVARQWFRFATRRADTEADACALASITEDFNASDQNLRELIVAIAVSDPFRSRSQP